MKKNILTKRKEREILLCDTATNYGLKEILFTALKQKKKALAYWESYKKENNSIGKKGLIKRVEIIPFRGC